jgi:fructokinase
MRIGIDIGGTKIEGVALAPGGEELARRRLKTPRGDYQDTVDCVAEIVRELEAEVSAPCTVGVAMPGAISPATGLIKNANSTWLNGQPLDKDLALALDREVRLANDANCFALSEAVDGAGAGHHVVFGVIVGTGCGGGIVIDRQVLTGPHAIAGEWGHNPLPWPDKEEFKAAPKCYCGKRGCLETWISGPGFADDYERISGDFLEPEYVVRAAQHGDSYGKKAIARLVDRMARGLSTVINLIDPDVIVLGGGLSNIAALYDLLPAVLPEYVFSDRIDVAVVPNKHGDSSGVRGAAWLWPEPSDEAPR